MELIIPVYSPSKLYVLLLDASINMPIADNFEGSYLTFKSINGLVFAIDLLVAGRTIAADKTCAMLTFIEAFLPSGWTKCDFSTVSGKLADSNLGLLAKGHCLSSRDFYLFGGIAWCVAIVHQFNKLVEAFCNIASVLKH